MRNNSMDMFPKGYTCEAVWQNASEQVQQEVAALWRAHTFLDEKAIAQRLPEIAAISRSPSGELVALNSAYVYQEPTIGLKFYGVRVFVKPGEGQQHISILLTRFLRIYWEEQLAKGKLDPEIKGIYSDIQSSAYNDTLRHCMYKENPAFYVGRSGSGGQNRIYYFQGATL